ncbi:MAG: hypothetical protein EAZ08_01475 [Cytophagales bacterium]|nr:MAG: hypothetical protein EAZ08_01475 [Cytophagales bacterium]
MTNLTLDSYDVLELNEGEMRETEGGSPALIFIATAAVGGIIGNFAWDAVNNWNDCVKAFNEGWDLGKRY